MGKRRGDCAEVSFSLLGYPPRALRPDRTHGGNIERYKVFQAKLYSATMYSSAISTASESIDIGSATM